MPFEPQPFGKYTLVEKLAVGGMAMIYRAKIEGVKGFQKDLVIKQILPQYSDMPDFIDMFIDEAKIAVNLNHANIVPVYELGEIDGALYIAMEYVPGRDTGLILEACEEQGRVIPPHIAAYVLTQVCRALDYAHNKRDDATRKPLKIIHRDVSPNNVIVSFDGDVKIIDFGIAKATIKVSVTQFGTLKGKMIYMSPEQASEKALDHRSDIFSAGILLYELVTGRQPYGGDNFALLQENVKKAVFERPSEVNPDLESDLEEIILKAMQLDPADRFQTAFEMERALSQYLVGTGQQVFDRDVAQFMGELFATDEAGATPRDPTPVSKVPTVPNLRDGTTNPAGRGGDTRPGVVPPDASEDSTPVSKRRQVDTSLIRNSDGAIPGPPSEDATKTPVSADKVPASPAAEDSTERPSRRIAVMGSDDTVISSRPGEVVPGAPEGDGTPTEPVGQESVKPPPSWEELTGDLDQTVERASSSEAPAPPPPPPSEAPTAAAGPPPPPPGNGGAPPVPQSPQVSSASPELIDAVLGEPVEPEPPPAPPEPEVFVPRKPAEPSRDRAASPQTPEKAPWEEEDGQSAADSRKKRSGLGGFFGRLMGRKGKETRPEPKGDKKKKKGEPDLLTGNFDSAQDFLENGYANYSGTRGMFLTTRSVDEVPLGVDTPMELIFTEPAARFQVHGSVIWRRAKEGFSKGKKLPAGLAIEFVVDKDDDLQALFNYLGLE